MKSNFYLLTVALLAISNSLLGQISFLNANAKLGYGDHFSGVAIGVADMNADGYDDIVHLRNGRILTIELQKPDGSGFTTVNIGQISNGSQWSMCIADADNNGFNDILAGGSYDGVKLVQASADGTSYTTGNLPGSNIFLQGSNFADINNDGHLDVFACHDDGMSRIWGNNGDGTFSPVDWIDMTTVPASDNSGNYGSIWTDFDNDGDLDLYIAKCRQGVNNPADGRRINQLFVNNGDGSFSQDTSNVSGLRIGAQSWTADFGDFDNDGDLDCFITNHDAPSQLLLNDGTGVFTDVTAGSGVSVQGLPIQGIFRDFDNDGFLDIIVSGTRHHMFRNNGNGTFTDMGAGAFGNVQMESFAVGDLNNDGKLDVYGGYALVYTTPSTIPDKIWLNTTENDNHYLTVRLEGTTSNRNAIGARISIFGPWGVQIREVRSGESYGIMNSMFQHFGLGENTGVDSLVVNWPSGLREVFYDVPGDQSIHIKEGACKSPDATIALNGPDVFCPGESAELTVSGGSSYLWSNGETDAVITATEGGLYSAVVSDGSDCTTITPSIELTVDPPVFPVVIVDGEDVFCLGGSVLLRTEEAESYTWSNGATTQTIQASVAGEYYVSVPGLCRDFDSEPVVITVLDAPAPEVTNDTIPEAGEAVLTATGNEPRWYDLPTGGEPLATGNMFVIDMLTETDTFYVEDISLYEGEEVNAGPVQHTGGSQYSGNTTNGSIIFDALQPFTLRNVRVYTDMAGVRIIELRDNTGAVLQSRTVDLPTGESILPLFFEVPVGSSHSLTTNTAQNQASFGFASPRMRRTSGGSVSYPYITPNVVAMTNSNFGLDVYYYFYNWDIKLADTECISERMPAYAVLQPVSSSQEPLSAFKVSVAPNPTSGETTLSIAPALTTQAVLLITDQQGRRVAQWSLAVGQSQYTFDAGRLAPGVYHIQIATGEAVLHRTLVVQR
ncbi:MAG: VCBS repeat-containing protein [Saprospiraceae bacterium]|nr:VCBS repeat-containing protein [Saprospiraceae bacterium]